MKKLISCRNWLAAPLLVLCFVSNIDAQKANAVISRTDVTKPTATNGSITLDVTGLSLPEDGSYLYQSSVTSPEGVEVFRTPILGTGEGRVYSSATNLKPGVYTITQVICGSDKGSPVYSIEKSTIEIGRFDANQAGKDGFALYQNHPNPVLGQTTIGFNLAKEGPASLTVTSLDGKVVKVINGDYKAGYNAVTINKSDIQASGIFYYRLETAENSAFKKMLVVE